MALIDQVADQCGLFISDLKAQDNYSVIAEILTQIDSDSFPVTDWNHFITYLFERTLRLHPPAKPGRHAWNN